MPPLLFAATAGGVQVCAADNNVVCTFGLVLIDTDPAVGSIRLASNNIGGLVIEGSLHTQDLAPPLNVLNSASLSIQNTTGAAVAFSAVVSATHFAGPVDTTFTTGSVTWVAAAGSTISLKWYNDPANAQGAETNADRPGLLVHDSSSNLASGPGHCSFSVNGGPFKVANPVSFSMTLAVDAVITAGGSLISGGQSQIAVMGGSPSSRSQPTPRAPLC